MSKSDRSVALIGPGAIGGATIGALIEAGNDPLICARSPFSDLTVEHPAGRIVPKVTGEIDRSRRRGFKGSSSTRWTVTALVRMGEPGFED